ncbi:hypothetical protein FJT64_010877 [Amphibalanus amphitrite]|uniref:Uncharacterized protein n=1 Tax=Amphibalanus amphitrite TaxID=1232801 RepID=A0A6A4VKP0_AMPAM|nr:hypothetical protein FJT64_010877 [Amphibalanus amphitrite]
MKQAFLEVADHIRKKYIRNLIDLVVRLDIGWFIRHCVVSSGDQWERLCGPPSADAPCPSPRGTSARTEPVVVRRGWPWPVRQQGQPAADPAAAYSRPPPAAHGGHGAAAATSRPPPAHASRPPRRWHGCGHAGATQRCRQPPLVANNPPCPAHRGPTVGRGTPADQYQLFTPAASPYPHLYYRTHLPASPPPPPPPPPPPVLEPSSVNPRHYRLWHQQQRMTEALRAHMDLHTRYGRRRAKRES